MVRFSRRSGRNPRVGGPSARFGRVPVGFGRRTRGRGRRDDGGRLRRRDTALSLRYASSDPQTEREAGARHDGVHSKGGDDGLKAQSLPVPWAVQKIYFKSPSFLYTSKAAGCRGAGSSSVTMS